MNRKLKIIYLALGLISTNLLGQGYVLGPFKDSSLDRDEVREDKSIHSAYQESVKKSLFQTEPRPLSQIEKKTPLGSNHDRLSVNYMTNLASSDEVQKTQFIQPGMCYIEDFVVFYVTVTDLSDDQLLAVSSRSMTRKSFKAEKESEAINGFYTAMTKESLRQADVTSKIVPDSAFKAKFQLKNNTTRRDDGSLECLNLLVTGKISRKYRVINTHGGLEKGLVRNHLGIKGFLMRSTRNFQNDYTIDQSNESGLDVRMIVRPSESVFGHSIPMSISLSTRLNQQDNQLVVGELTDLTNFINEELATLAFKDNPKISRIYGAWAYLDKGRAWGLKMNDRLINDANSIKGHVIGYFGPEHKIKSPDGHLIHEGAIIFIRKGQDQTKIGLEMSFDTKTYPAPFPKIN